VKMWRSLLLGGWLSVSRCNITRSVLRAVKSCYLKRCSIRRQNGIRISPRMLSFSREECDY
jgi:hypothetical protein